jgi:thiamine kinase-like enzyme
MSRWAAGSTQAQRVGADDSITSGIVETLEEGLARLRGRCVRIRALHRDTSSRSSSYRTERLHVITDDDRALMRIYFKDLNPAHQVTQSWALRRADRRPSNLEIQMYQSVLSSERFGTPQFYGSRWEPEHGRCWLFVEDVGPHWLQAKFNFAASVDACRWAARFHASTRDLPASQTTFLPVYDDGHYRRTAERVSQMLPRLAAAECELVRRGLAYFTERIRYLSMLPRSVIHGQFFPANVMFRPPPATHRVAVIDWETAALGPGVFDLASISSGTTRERRLALWRAYADQYQTDTGQEIEWEHFQRECLAGSVFHALEWLVWWAQHPEPSKRLAKFLRELDALLEQSRNTHRVE